MNDKENIEQALLAFNNLSAEDTAILKGLNTRIQIDDSKWGVYKGGEKTTDGVKQMPWVQSAPLISEFIDFMAGRNLLPFFEWMKWSEGSELFMSNDQTKYESIDLETALKLIYAATRKERFADGTLAWAFKSGGFPELIDRLLVLKATQT